VQFDEFEQLGVGAVFDRGLADVVVAGDDLREEGASFI